ncbi:MAG TPA: hypothetical protein VIM19_18040 [Actinomycetes bacterium]
MTIDTTLAAHATQTVCLAVPLLPGTSSTDREEMLTCWHGERSEEHAASRRRHGVTRESVWIQTTPAGDVAVVLIESADISQALLGLATSQAPFDAWFRNHLHAVHGLDLARGISLPDQILDFRG